MTTTKKFNFTRRSVESLPIPKEKRATYYDQTTRGLGLLIQTSGHRAFFWYRSVQGYPKWLDVGVFPDLSIEQARKKADEYNVALAKWKAAGFQGQDPFGPQRGDVTLGTLLEDYVEKHLTVKSKRPERAGKDVRWAFGQYCAAWRNRAPGTIRREHIRTLHADIGRDHGQHTANRTVQMLKAVYNFGIDAEMIEGPNPCARIKLFHEAKRDRFLQADEAPKFFRALVNEKNIDLRDFIVLSLFGAARRSDTLSMQWADIDIKRGLWTIPDPKNRTPYVVALTPEATDVLARRQATSQSPWVFPSPTGKAGHILDMKRAWKRFLKRAELQNFRVHDLRRTNGSWQAGLGTSLPIIGKSLGHKSLSATEIYSRVTLEPVRESVSAATKAMMSAGKVSRQKLLAAPNP